MKVSWPTRKTVINLTLVVIGVSLLFAIFIGAVDYVFTESIKLLTSLTTPTATSQTVVPDLDVGDIDIEGTSLGDIDVTPIE